MRYDISKHPYNKKAFISTTIFYHQIFKILADFVCFGSPLFLLLTLEYYLDILMRLFC